MSTIPQGRHRRRALAGAALVTSALVVLAACSSSKSSSSTATTAAASATTGAAGAATTTAAPSAAPSTVTLTLIGPFSGPFATSSQSIQKSLQYAFDLANAGQGPETVPGTTFKLVAADDQNVPSNALDLARTALANGSKAIFLIGHAEVEATKPLTNSGQLLGIQTDPPDTDGDGTLWPYNFDFYPLDNLGINAQMKFASGKNLSKFAVVAGTGDQYQGYVDDVTKDLPSGASVVNTQRFDPSTTDYSSIATKVQQSGADSIWFFGTGSNVQQFYQALQAANINLPIFNAYGGLTCNCVAFPKSFLSHVYVGFPSIATLDASGNPVHTAYSQAIQGLWTKDNITSLTAKFFGGNAIGIEAGEAFVWAVKTAGSDDPAKLKAAFESTSANGGQSFMDPSIKYSWSATNHEGYPSDQVVVIADVLNLTWPGFFPAASS